MKMISLKYVPCLICKDNSLSDYCETCDEPALSNIGLCEYEEVYLSDLLSKLNMTEKLNIIFEIIKGKIPLDTKSNKKNNKKNTKFSK